MAPFGISWEPHSPLYGLYIPEQPRATTRGPLATITVPY